MKIFGIIFYSNKHSSSSHILFYIRSLFSGKTLAFLVPLLEKLYRRQFTPPDGPGAIVLSPTRELAVQTFQVLRAIGSYHHFSAGILVGGKKEFGLEQQHVPKMNIIIATPGRLLQHLEQTAGFDVDRVCVLVLDEGMGYFDVVVLASTCRIFSYFCSLYRPMLQLKFCCFS